MQKSFLGAALSFAVAFTGCQHVHSQPRQPVSDSYDVPRLRDIVIDGNAADWETDGLHIDVLSPSPANSRNTKIGDAWMRLAWDEKGLLLLVTGRNSSFSMTKTNEFTWKNDAVDVFLATADSRDAVQATVIPTMAKDKPFARTSVRDSRLTQSLRKIPMSAEAAISKPADASYTVELRIPWDQLSITPAVGTQVAVQVFVTAIDEQGDRSKLIWYPVDGANYDKSRLRRVRLTETPSSPVDWIAAGTIERMRRINVDLTTTVDHANSPVEVRDGVHVLADARLESTDRLATARLTLPMPGLGQKYHDLAVYAAGQRVAAIELEDIERARKKVLFEAPMSPSSAVFTGRVLPKIEFDNPSLVEDAVGRYEISTTYYDADFNIVTRAIKPGRYGAIVDVKSELGATIHREFTLFKHDKPLTWRNVKLDGTFSLPVELGIDPEVFKNQAPTVADMFSRELRTSFQRGHETAIALAGLSEISSDAGPVPQRLGVRQRNAQWWYELRKRLGQQVPYRYEVHVPEGSPPDGSDKWPVLIFLHGLGERGDDLTRVAVNGPLKEINEGKKLPFVVVAPLCPGTEWWNSTKLNDMLDDVLQKYPTIDRERIYLTGLSMGGFGSWAWVLDRPDRFAAVAPICGGGDPLDVDRIKNVPIWIFHGAKDTAVLPQESYDMVKALRDVHGRVRFTLYPNADHDSWTDTYDNPELYEWLLRQRLGKPTEPPATQPGTRPSN